MPPCTRIARGDLAALVTYSALLHAIENPAGCSGTGGSLTLWRRDAGYQPARLRLLRLGELTANLATRVGGRMNVDVGLAVHHVGGLRGSDRC
jgi:hypothetical protein